MSLVADMVNIFLFLFMYLNCISCEVSLMSALYNNPGCNIKPSNEVKSGSAFLSYLQVLCFV